MKESMRRTAGPLVKAHSKGLVVRVEQHVKDKMQGWCNAANGEVSGLFCVKLQDAVFHVYDVFLPEQNGSTGFTKIDGHANGRLYGFLQKKYGLEGMADLKGWWHTHYNFNVFWSGTDDDTAQSNAILAEDWSLSIVINQRGEWLARVDVVSPIPVMVDELPIVFVPNSKHHAKRDYKRDIDKWVHPFPERKVFVTKRTYEIKEPIQKPKFINYGGMLIPYDKFEAVMECPCGDMTCIDCKENLKELNKIVATDEISNEDEIKEAMTRGIADV